MLFELKVFRSTSGVGQLRLESPSLEAAQATASAQGYAVLEVHPVAGSEYRAAHSAKSFPLLLFSRELWALLKAGLPLLEALETLAEKEPAAGVRNVIDGLAQRLRAGQSLSLALESFPQVFPPLYVAGIRASEQSGAIGEALRRFIAYQEQIDVVRKKVRSAMIYPTLLLGAGGLVIVFLMGYVVPRFSRIYAERATDLHVLSRLLLEWGRFIDANGGVVALVIALLLVGAWNLATRPAWQARVIALFWRIPAAGDHLKLYQLSRMYRTLGMLLSGGAPISAALGLVAGLLAPNLRANLALAEARVREGLPLSQALAQQALTTPVALRLLRVGERTGQMDEMLDSIAAFHDDEIARRVDLLTRTIEPLLMLLIGLLIGAIVILMYLPIFELAGSMGS